MENRAPSFFKPYDGKAPTNYCSVTSPWASMVALRKMEIDEKKEFTKKKRHWIKKRGKKKKVWKKKGHWPKKKKGKKSTCQWRRQEFDPGSGRCPEKWEPTQYSCLKNPADGGAWWTIIHGVTEELDTTQRLNNNFPFPWIWPWIHEACQCSIYR